MSREDVRAQAIEASMLHAAAETTTLRSSAANTRNMAGCLFPILGVIGASTLIDIFGVKDPTLMMIVGAVGCLFGLLLASLLFNWFRMQALLGRRISDYLDTQ